jgi:hypothetical protein
VTVAGRGRIVATWRSVAALSSSNIVLLYVLIVLSISPACVIAIAARGGHIRNILGVHCVRKYDAFYFALVVITTASILIPGYVASVFFYKSYDRGSEDNCSSGCTTPFRVYWVLYAPLLCRRDS